ADHDLVALPGELHAHVVTGPVHPRRGEGALLAFGGTQITMAAGLANLNYLLEHDLQGNARRVGGLLIERLRAVAAHVPAVREVRGRGLMIGIEVTKPGTDEADPQTAAAVLEAARAGGLLIGKGGGHNTSSLRVAPPLSLNVAEAEEGAAILENALRSIQ
ncbi:aminotransferase class III-fold pyridoxal phosphate-dependent enzyme, partial [Streptomyces sp. NPDC002130]|uniref:aminotransferase class III-fold pyridoxal phosphate-dependent enzyme n=1 Tax=Streptomyces sp. NPDC002130 TaxID=3155568 RepID=UPI00332C98CE